MGFIYERKDGRRYKLIENSVIVRGGKKAKVYYFVAEDVPRRRSGKEIDRLPEGFEIKESPRAGNHPIVSKIRR